MRARGFALLAVVLLPLVAGAAAVTIQEVEEALTCQCGCGLTVHSCNHLNCGSGIPLKQEVATLVSEGLGRDEILLRFRDRYGEKILSAPTTEGFNLTAWILPFVVLGAGVLVVATTVRRWVVRGTGSAAPQPIALVPSDADRQRLEEELRREEP